MANKPLFSLQSRFSYRARAKAKKSSGKRLAWLTASLFFVSLFAFFCVVFPDFSGNWGQTWAQFLSWFVGKGRFFLPLLTIYWCYLFTFKKEETGTFLKVVLTGAMVWGFITFLSLSGQAVWNENYGGIVGWGSKEFLSRLFGVPGAWIVTIGLFVIESILLIGESPKDLTHKAVKTIHEDWKEWKDSKVIKPKEKQKKTPVVPAQASLAAAPVAPKLSPKIMNLPSEIDQKPILPKEEKKAPPIVKPAFDSQKEKTTGSVIPTKPEVSKIPYKSPSLDIFDAPVKSSKPVEKEELTSRAKLLEQTLANFNIAAHVVEIHPGPVITRYDLEPAPGVKVSSIASRSDDLALAMRSIGIRVLAPIPGKGAVGVEIPNSHPESVCLKDLLARPEFFNHPSPLAFVLGKTVSGEPYIVDLAAMPHMLIAGATGAGKSVCVHALISSILYRMPPDLVKFVMIDPKRLELPSYFGIPHLYDPRVAPIDASIITNSKQAAKALTRLVKVMEYRYDLFAKSNVRNIDSYNKKRKEAGLPPEYYLVVIIDELADLMLTAPKEVEDSVQRLAQMARAVGIHLVLATQRPSVDVITGVIKANLPSRIALRVASAIDSRVIVDTIGAESLLGKGDMLFLPPAQPEPIRVQGAFVSEKEVENLVQHVKQFGMPFYEDLFSSGSALEFAVEDKKEMKELIDALQLIQERKRVSQDLLKAHFGSSSRATNVLSLLEVKGFIQKPEGSNRWDINFDMIEEFLSKVNMVPEGEMAQ
ncbi:MAG: DNA translocase FtsK 4TM domain-containing protein [Elusimicrobiota bacterium]